MGLVKSTYPKTVSPQNKVKWSGEVAAFYSFSKFEKVALNKTQWAVFNTAMMIWDELNLSNNALRRDIYVKVSEQNSYKRWCARKVKCLNKRAHTIWNMGTKTQIHSHSFILSHIPGILVSRLLSNRPTLALAFDVDMVGKNNDLHHIHIFVGDAAHSPCTKMSFLWWISSCRIYV